MTGADHQDLHQRVKDALEAVTRARLDEQAATFTALAIAATTPLTLPAPTLGSGSIWFPFVQELFACGKRRESLFRELRDNITRRFMAVREQLASTSERALQIAFAQRRPPRKTGLASLLEKAQREELAAMWRAVESLLRPRRILVIDEDFTEELGERERTLRRLLNDDQPIIVSQNMGAVAAPSSLILNAMRAPSDFSSIFERNYRTTSSSAIVAFWGMPAKHRPKDKASPYKAVTPRSPRRSRHILCASRRIPAVDRAARRDRLRPAPLAAPAPHAAARASTVRHHASALAA